MVLGLRHNHIEGPHHFVVFVFRDMAVKDIAEPLPGLHRCACWRVELGDDSVDESGHGADRILPCGPFVRIRWPRRPGKKQLARVEIRYRRRKADGSRPETGQDGRESGDRRLLC